MITPRAQARLDANPREFFRTMIDVVVEPSEVGLTIWDDEGRHIVIAHGQLFQPLPGEHVGPKSAKCHRSRCADCSESSGSQTEGADRG